MLSSSQYLLILAVFSPSHSQSASSPEIFKKVNSALSAHFVSVGDSVVDSVVGDAVGETEGLEVGELVGLFVGLAVGYKEIDEY